MGGYNDIPLHSVVSNSKRPDWRAVMPLVRYKRQALLQLVQEAMALDHVHRAATVACHANTHADIQNKEDGKWLIHADCHI